MTRTNALADRHTIVDMNLRLVRFVMGVVAALVFAFGFALLTSNKKTLTYVHEDELLANETLSAKASDVVENYNTLFGYILFAGGKIFEVFCETLIFPTLATYLHNCSLYPGDQPARRHSISKARCIFWGLKTVIILMNVGFTSVYVGKTTLDMTATSRRLTAINEFTGMEMHMESPWTVEPDADLHSILRTSVSGFTTPFESKDTCPWANQGNTSAEQQPWGVWADTLDTTSVSFSFPSYAWNTAFLTSNTTAPTKITTILLQDDLDHRSEDTSTSEWDPVELYSIFQQSIAKMGLANASVAATTPMSLAELRFAIVGDLKAVLPATARLNDLGLSLQHREAGEDVEFTTLVISIPFESDNTGMTLCGASGCVYATATSVLKKLHMQSRVSIASHEGYTNSALVYSATSQYVLDPSTVEPAPQEVLTLSLSKLTWKLRPLHTYYNAACADEHENQCLGLSLPLATDNDVLLVGEKVICAQHVVHPVALVTLHSATILSISRSDNSALVSWHRLLSSNGKLIRPSSSECISLVDAYLMHLESNQYYFDGQRTQDMLSAALFYLLQRGAPMSEADIISRRRLASSAVLSSSVFGSKDDSGDAAGGATTDIEVNVPTATALVTLAGCIFIVLLTLCVLYLPTQRVKLSSDTTPAAQYVQILTDDLYSDLVHKKRLRFANGDCLLFNEYVVDAIVLHAKRDQTKKIYL